MRICSIETGIHYHCFIEPDKRILISSESGLFAERRQLIFFFFSGKLLRYIVKHSEDFILVSFGEFCYIIAIQF